MPIPSSQSLGLNWVPQSNSYIRRPTLLYPFHTIDLCHFFFLFAFTPSIRCTPYVPTVSYSTSIANYLYQLAALFYIDDTCFYFKSTLTVLFPLTLSYRSLLSGTSFTEPATDSDYFCKRSELATVGTWVEIPLLVSNRYAACNIIGSFSTTKKV